MATKRKRAKPAVRRVPPGRTAKPPKQKIQRLLTELQVHAEEITAQNEQLLTVQHELEEARDRFADLYDFAPIGYVSIDGRGRISEINLAGAVLLGRARSFLINLPLAATIAVDQRRSLEDFIKRARGRAEARGESAQTVEATARVDHNRVLRFIARPDLIGASGELFVAIVDVSEERRVADQRRDALARERAVAEDRAREVVERTLAEARIKALLERVVTAQEEERRRIARNLHDHLGQQLTALRLTLEAIDTDAGTPRALRGRLDQLQGIVSKMDRDVDLLAWDLRPVALDDAGLPAALADLVSQWSSVSQVPAEFHQSMPAGFRLPEEIESNLYRIVQEALNNIAKHAAATRVSVLLEHRGDEAAVIIEDDGRGFDPDAAFASRERHTMMGLLGMRERAALIDGDVQIESAAGHGTTVFVRIPVKRRS